MDELFLLRSCQRFVISRRPFTAEVCVECQASICEVCGAQSGTRTGFSPSTSSFLCRYYSIRAPYSILSYCYAYIKKWAKPGNLQTKQCCFAYRGHWTKKYFVILRRYPDRPTDRSFSWFSICAPCFSCGPPSIT
jgi:hypothetical protein